MALLNQQPKERKNMDMNMFKDLLVRVPLTILLQIYVLFPTFSELINHEAFVIIGTIFVYPVAFAIVKNVLHFFSSRLTMTEGPSFRLTK